VLHGFVAADPRYAWRRLNGVFVVRPESTWNDGEHFLNRAVAPFAATFEDLAPALRAMSSPFSTRRFQIGGDLQSLRHLQATLNSSATAERALDPFPPWIPEPERGPFVVHFGGGTLLDALNALVDGRTREFGAVGWIVTYCSPPTEASAAVWVPVTDDAARSRKIVTLADSLDHADPCLQNSRYL
jgi:hypothetical protein